MPRDQRFIYSHPPTLIIGETSFKVKTKASLNRERGMMAFLSTIEPKNIYEALSKVSWVIFMEEELSQFKNKLNEEGEVVKNKARLVV